MVNEKELNKISKKIAKIFEKNGWYWMRSKMIIPDWKMIKEHIVEHLEQVKKSDGWVSCGRIRMEYIDGGYDILIEADEFHLDD